MPFGTLIPLVITTVVTWSILPFFGERARKLWIILDAPSRWGTSRGTISDPIGFDIDHVWWIFPLIMVSFVAIELLASLLLPSRRQREQWKADYTKDPVAAVNRFTVWRTLPTLFVALSIMVSTYMACLLSVGIIAAISRWEGQWAPLVAFLMFAGIGGAIYLLLSRRARKIKRK